MFNVTIKGRDSRLKILGLGQGAVALPYVAPNMPTLYFYIHILGYGSKPSKFLGPRAVYRITVQYYNGG